jgi:AMP nucleosidase
MPGHYAGLLNTQTLGDYVLDHSYVWEERVLNEDLPPWVPIPTLPRCKMRSRRQRKISRASPVMT